MKLSCSIPLLFLLPTCLASDVLLRGTPRKLTGGTGNSGGGGGGDQPDNGCFSFRDGCPRTGYTELDCFSPCTSNADCASLCTGFGDDCCCVNSGGFSWCGVPQTCSDFQGCMAEPTTPAPTPATTDDRGNNSTGGTVGMADIYGCDSLQGEVWCESLNRCEDSFRCSFVIIGEEHGCVLLKEDYCDIRNDCVLKGWVPGGLDCPSDAGTTPCANYQLVPKSVVSADGDIWTYQGGRVQYDTLTHLSYNVHELSMDDTPGDFVTVFDASLLYEEWQLPLINGVGCVPLYDIVAYVQLSGRNILQLCYDLGESVLPASASQQSFPIPACSDVDFGPILAYQRNNYYIARFVAVPGQF